MAGAGSARCAHCSRNCVNQDARELDFCASIGGVPPFLSHQGFQAYGGFYTALWD